MTVHCVVRRHHRVLHFQISKILVVWGKDLGLKLTFTYAVEDSSFGAEADLAENGEGMVVGGGDSAAAWVEHVGAF